MTNNGRVFCIGETVLDIIFQNDLPIAAKPGGSMLNSAVSLGRAGIPVYFISDFATDHAGELIHTFLIENGVQTTYISRYDDGKTGLSLAFLDHQQNADYSFYKIFPEERLNQSFPTIEPDDIVLFGSFYAITRSIRSKLLQFLEEAKSRGAYLIYDPNFRKDHLSDLETLRPLIIENIGMANLVRGSDEDFRYIFAAANADEAFFQVDKAGCRALVYTRNSAGVEVITGQKHYRYSVPAIKSLSTIGAGDAFNAGLVYAMINGEYLSGTSSASSHEEIINSGIRFATDVCQSLDNYISVEFGNVSKKHQLE